MEDDAVVVYAHSKPFGKPAASRHAERPVARGVRAGLLPLISASLWLGLSLVSGGSAHALSKTSAPGPGSGLGPLPFSSGALAQAGSKASPGGFPKLPLFAQNTAADPAQPSQAAPAPQAGTAAAETVDPLKTTVPFATPDPGSIVDDEDEESDAEKKRKREAAKAKPVECDNDAQCPAQTVCSKNKCRSPSRTLSALIYYHRPGAIGFRMLLPFYYHFWRPGQSTRVLFPLYGESRNEKAGTRHMWVFPTYEYKRTPEERTHRLWPLFFYSDYGKAGKASGLFPLYYAWKRNDRSGVVLPPFLFARWKTGDTANNLFLPLLLFVRKQPNDTLALFLGLGYYRKTEEKTSAVFFPLLFYSKTKEQRRTSIVPLFFEGENSVTGEKYATLLPLFFYKRWKDKSRLILTPLGGSYKDQEAGTTTTLMLVPPTIHRDSPVQRVTVIPPLAVFYKNKQTGRAWGYVGPFFYSRDSEGSSDGLFPLYFRVQNRLQKSSTDIAPPLLLAVHRSQNLSFGFFGPFYGWSRKQDGAYGGGLLPLLSFASGPKPHFVLLPPLVVYTRDREAGKVHFSLGPVFYRHTTKGPEAGYDAGLFPLLFVSRHGKTSSQFLFPIFYHHKRPFNERFVVGILGYYDRVCPQVPGDPRAAVQAGLIPFFFYKRSANHSFTALFPLFFESRTKTQQVVVAGPVFYSRKERTKELGPSESFGVLPLFYAQRSKESAFVVGPLFGYRRTPERRTLVVGPFIETVSQLGTPNQSINRAFLPLFFFHCSPGRKATVLFPLFMQVREHDTTFRSLALIYYGVSRPTSQTHALVPLFFLHKSPTRTTAVFLPFFYHRDRKEGEQAFGLLPLFGYGHDIKREVLATPIGFYLRDHVAGRARAAFLTFYADISRDRADFGMFPLFFATRRGTAKAAFVLPFFYDSRDPAKDRSFTLLGPLFFGHRGKATYGGFAPLLYGKNDGDGGFSLLIAPLLYASHRPGGPNWLLTPLFGFKTATEGYRFYFTLFYMRRDAERRTTALLPLFYDSKDLHTEQRTTMLFPLFFRSATPDKSFWMVTPLFWHQRTLTRQITLFVPLLLDINNRFRERITAFGPVLPLFIRARDDANDTTSWIFPPLLTYVKRKSDGYHNAVVFPLFWHFKDAEKQTTVFLPLLYYAKRPATKTVVVLPLFGYRRDEHNTKSLFVLPLLFWSRNYGYGGRERVLFPLFWHFQSAERSTTVMFPLFIHARRPNYTVTVVPFIGAFWTSKKGKSTLVLNTYYYKGTGEYAGAWDFHFFPLFHVGRPRRQDIEWSILTGLVGYSRIGIHRTLRLLWGIFIPLEPVNAPKAWYGATLRMNASE